MRKKNKGYALIITIVLTFFISTISLAAFISVYRYSAIINSRFNQLQETVGDEVSKWFI